MAQLPSVSIAFSRVMVTQNVEVGRNYVLESSFDMVTWKEAGPQFTAKAESIETEFMLEDTGRYFRLRDLGETNTNQPLDVTLFISELGMKLMSIPAGTFVMGSPDDEIGRRPEEGPPTTVTISKPFWMGETEITQSQWQAVMGNNPSGNIGEDLPVEEVSWNDAMAFCEKLNQEYGNTLPLGYRYILPTEAQWEYACRAGTTTRFYYGDDPGYNQLGEYAWYLGNSGERSHPVGGKLPNIWGLHDMHGNVWEWCLDHLGDFYPGGSVTDPLGPESASARAVHGGGWFNHARGCRSAYRGKFWPDNSLSDLGFRVALSPVHSE